MARAKEKQKEKEHEIDFVTTEMNSGMINQVKNLLIKKLKIKQGHSAQRLFLYLSLDEQFIDRFILISLESV